MRYQDTSLRQVRQCYSTRLIFRIVTYLPTTLVKLPDLLALFERAAGAAILDLSACPFMFPFALPLGEDLAGFFARPLLWPAMAAARERAVRCACGPAAVDFHVRTVAGLRGRGSAQDSLAGRWAWQYTETGHIQSWMGRRRRCSVREDGWNQDLALEVTVDTGRDDVRARAMRVSTIHGLGRCLVRCNGAGTDARGESKGG